MGNLIDLTGQTFGSWFVINKDCNKSKNDKSHTYWNCLCTECMESKRAIRADHLKNGSSTNCGCLRNHNKYDLSRGYGIGYDYKNDEFYFDLEDYDKIKNGSWFVKKGTNYTNSDNYVYGYLNGNIVSMHSIIMNTPNGYEVDHIHGKSSRNDNRKSNLRLATSQQNNMNMPVKSNNTSGIAGVFWDKSRNKWRAEIQYKGHVYYLGRFINKEDAIIARKAAEEKYFGEWSYDNSQKMLTN